MVVSCLLLAAVLSTAVDRRLEDKSGLFSVEIDGNWGFINRQGEVVIKPIYDRVGFFSEDLASARQDGKWGFINPKGNMIIPPRFTFADCFSEGLAAVMEGDRFGYIDKTGKWKIPAQFQTANTFSQGLALVEEKGAWRFIDKTGKADNTGEFEYAYDFSEGLAAVQHLGKWGFIDLQGKFVIEPKLDNAYEFHEGWAPVGIDGESNFVNKQGVKMTDGTVFLATQIFSEGLAVVQSSSNGKYGYVNKSGKYVIPAQYDIVFLFREGLAAVSKSGEYGFIDKTGKEVIPLKYAYTEVFVGGLARVKNSSQWIYIDKTGRQVWPKQNGGLITRQHSSVHIMYDMAGLTQVIIKDGRLKYITSQYQGQNPVAAGGPDDYKRSGKERAVSEAEIDSVINLFRTSGFLELKDTYGTDAKNRNYPVTISIQTADISKSVLFRSHPDFTAPPAFKEIEDAILKLAQNRH